MQGDFFYKLKNQVTEESHEYHALELSTSSHPVYADRTGVSF